MNNNNNTDKHPNPNPSSPSRVEGSRSLFLDGIGDSGFNCENPKKKRSKLIRIGNDLGASSSRSNNNGYPKQESRKKTEPNIIPPCSECGKQFLSWKALFGHMRCHPERQWRGINPPRNLKKPVRTLDEEQEDLKTNWTNEDQEVATSLLMLANGSVPMESRQSIRFNLEGSSKEAVDYRRERDRAQVLSDRLGIDGVGSSSLNYRFECSSCKKVFGSHQALGGHRASHKNVKGCFAITRKDDSLSSEIVELNHEGESIDGNEEKDGKMATGLVHKCEICYKVFCSGQALGGHMRCHSEKDDEHEPLLLGLGISNASKDDRFWDLNFPSSATNTQRNENPSSSTSELGLDLRLGFR